MSTHVVISRQWPDGDVLQVSVKAESSYPDALDQARKVAIDTYGEALDITVEGGDT